MIRLLPVLFAFIPSLAVAGDFARVSGRDSFVALVSGHELAVPLFGISLSVGASGQITGKAQGAEVTGCRSHWGMDLEGRPVLPHHAVERH